MSDKSGWSGFRKALCNESMQGMSWERQCDLAAGAGYRGIEIAPFTLVRQGVEELSESARRGMVEAMRNAGLECAGLHWLLSPPPAGLHMTCPEAAVRERTLDYFGRLIDFCADLGGEALILGSPKGRSTEGRTSPLEAKKRLAEGLARLADRARERGAYVLIEPLSRSQTDVVNTTEEAVEIVRAVGHPAVQTMFDFHNTADETLSFAGILDLYYPFIRHVHVMEMDGRYLGAGSGAVDYPPAFQLLKDRGYDGWVSVEVFDFSPGPLPIARESMKTLTAIERSLK